MRRMFEGYLEHVRKMYVDPEPDEDGHVVEFPETEVQIVNSIINDGLNRLDLTNDPMVMTEIQDETVDRVIKFFDLVYIEKLSHEEAWEILFPPPLTTTETDTVEKI